MAQPTRTVTNTYTNPATGQPATGRIVLTPLPAVWTDTDSGEILAGGGTFEVTAGAISQELVTTDAPGVEPAVGRYWVYEERLDGLPYRRRVFQLPAGDGSPVKISKIIEADPGRTEYMPVAGQPGPPGEKGDPGEQGPQPPVGAAGAGPAIALSSTDASVTNARTPTPHAASHGTGGSDVMTPASIGAATAVAAAAHAAATTSVHGIPDTAALETLTGAAGKVTAHAGATDPHGDRAFATSAAAAAVAALSALTQTVIKTADESRTATTAVADDQHLFASLEANSTYTFDTRLLLDGPEAADATLTFTAPAGATGGWTPVAGTLGTTVPDGSAQLKMAARQFGSNSDIGVMASSATLAGIMAMPQGIVTTGATPGLLRLRWAQQTSSASPVNLKAGSVLRVVKTSGAGPSASGINLEQPLPLPSDQGLLAWTGDPNDAGHVTAQGNAGVAGRITLVKIQIRKSITWSKIWFGLAGVDGSASLANCYLGVYDSAGTLKGVTADISSQLLTGATGKSVDLVAPFSAGPGEYFIAMLLGGTWTTNLLTFKATGAGITVNCGLVAPRLRYSNMLTGQTSLPSTLDLTQQTVSIINTGWASQWYGVS
ncbi:hypothetical protein [Streptomyces sp. NPDC051577]|uniref:hypothetical protein n=1 Tax=Streptomyces sp. NPDC051577 TaxID=3155166 RepID=UPI00343959E3